MCAFPKRKLNVQFQDFPKIAAFWENPEKNWSNLGKWWFSEKTQNLIAHFNKDFNLKTKNLKHLNILKKEIEKN